MRRPKPRATDTTLQHVEFTWPFTWVECCECSNEFRLERGWRFNFAPLRHYVSYKYICRGIDCGSSRRRAEAIATYALYARDSLDPDPRPPLPVGDEAWPYD